MNKFSEGQQVRITGGKYKGREAWFQAPSRGKEGHVFVALKTRNQSYVQLPVEHVEAI